MLANMDSNQTDWIGDTLAGRPALLNLKETAGILRVSRRTVARWIAAGDLRAVKTGVCVRIPRRALAEFLASRGAA
jgi:excisionase family DNA binding protein